jgi:FemAB-related protein (PEP-CTERM system-associated)
MKNIRVYARHELAPHLPRLEVYLTRRDRVPLSRHPAWLHILERELRHTPYCLEAVEDDQTRGFLPLAYVHSMLFGRFLVSLPYLNYGGVLADDDQTTRLLIDRAVELAQELRVRYLELRHEQPVEHPLLPARMSAKVHMRLALPANPKELWDGFDSRIRNKVRKGQKNDLTVHWGGRELLGEFYEVFSHNMRDLGTPVYGRGLFRGVLEQFPDRAELCVVRQEGKALAAALLLHGWGVTEVPSASALRHHNDTGANMLMYWHLLQRACERRQAVFDFGRCTRDTTLFDFKRHWGAEPFPAEWQYHLRVGTVKDMRPDNPGFRRLIQVWKKLPVGLTRLIGPSIVRCIP